MKYIKTYELWSLNKSLNIMSKPKQISNDDLELLDLFKEIQSGFSDSKLNAKTTMIADTYFIYKINNHISLEIGDGYIKISRNGSTFKKMNVDVKIINDIISFIESRSSRPYCI